MDQITICNMALARINQKPISSLTQANSPAAQFCSLFYSPVRQWLLRKHPWGFAKATAALAQTTATPLGWDFEYQLPDKCVRVWALTSESGVGTELVQTFVGDQMVYKPVHSSSQVVEFDVFGDKLVTNLEAAYAIYNQDIENEVLFDAMFTHAFSWRLAMDLAIPITGKMALRKQAQEGYAEAIAEAGVASSNERRVQQRVGSDLVEARR